MGIAATAEAIDGLLPQTQCRRCGHTGCAPYAEAIAAGEADINRCPPGGEATLVALAALTGRPPTPLDPACGTSAPLAVARINEARCIGCTLCIAACPVDAIIGAGKRLHAVLPSLCSGCELCVAPCPVDCIDMIPAERAWTADDAKAARERHRSRALRLARQERVSERRTAVAPGDHPRQPGEAGRATEPRQAGEADRATESRQVAETRQAAAARQAAVAAALDRARARRRAAAAT